MSLTIDVNYPGTVFRLNCDGMYEKSLRTHYLRHRQAIGQH